MLKSERECEELVLRIKILPALLSASTLTQTTTDAVSLGSHTLIRSACLLLCGSVFIKIAHRLFLQPTSRRRASLNYRLGVINKRLVSTRSTPARGKLERRWVLKITFSLAVWVWKKCDIIHETPCQLLSLAAPVSNTWYLPWSLLTVGQFPCEIV